MDNSRQYSANLSMCDIYPTEAQYGGGIGFSTMYMVLDSVPGGAFLDTLGFNVNELGTRPLVFYGGEGFAQMTGPWRLGGYAGIGSARFCFYESSKLGCAKV